MESAQAFMYSAKHCKMCNREREKVPFDQVNLSSSECVQLGDVAFQSLSLFITDCNPVLSAVRG